MQRDHIGKPILRLVVCIATVFAVSAALYAVPLNRRPLSAALCFLFVILIASAVWGFRYALFVSFLAALGFSWLLPPVGRFWLSDPRDVYVLAAFLGIGITISSLSDRARREALHANQRRAEAVAAHQRFRDLVNSVEGIVWEADAQSFVFSFVSEQAERILGYPVEQWLREPTFWKDHIHSEDRDLAVQFRVQATTEKRSRDFEYRMIGAEGRVVWLRDLVTVVAENGRAAQLRGVMIDITKRKKNEETLREQASLLSLTHDAIFVCDSSTIIKYWNRGAEEMYGWTAEEASGKVSHNLLKTAFPVPLEQIEAELIRAGRWEGELVHTKKDGTPVVAASRWSLQRSDRGTPIAILEINNDISEQKRAEQARQEIEEKWRAAFESNPTMYFIVDEAGVIVSVNAFGAEQLGYTVVELLGQPVLNVFLEPDRQAILRHASDCFEQPGQTMRWEARKIRKDGSMIWVRETGNAVVLKNQPVLLVVCEDITEQKRAEEAARRSEKELRDVIETIPALAFSIQPDGSTDFVNRRVLEYTGLPAEAISGPGWQSTVHRDDLGTHMEKWRLSFASGEAFENEARHRNAKGEYRWFLVRAVPLRDGHGNILKWYGILTDIEDRKRTEQSLGRSEAYLAEAQRLAKTGSWAFKPGLTKPLYWSDEMFRIWGFDPHQGLPDNETAWQRIHPEDLKAIVREQIERASSGNLKTDVVQDIRIVMPDGTVKYIHGASHPVVDDSGKVVEYIGTSVDITEGKRAEESLRRSEAYLAEAQRLTRTGSWAYNPFTGKTIYWSDEMFRIFGLDPQEGPSSEKFWQLVHPEDHDRVKERVEREAHEKREYVDEYRIVLADGTVKHILDIGHPVFNDAGDIAEFVGTTVDVTERKRAEETLRRSEAYLADAQKLSHTGSWAWSPVTGEVPYWSEEMFRIFGLDPQQGPPASEAFWKRVHPEDRDSMQELMRKAAREKTEYEHDHRIVFPDGTVRHIHAIGHPVLDRAGDVVEFVGTAVDVTERKRAEEEMRAAETRFRTFVDHATDALFVHSSDQGRVVDVNQRACESLGYTREELIGMKPSDFDCRVDPAFEQRVRERLEAGEVCTFEASHRRKDGTVFPVEVRMRLFWHVGVPFGLSLVRDITDRKRAEQERERLRQLEADLARMNRVSMMGELAASLAHEIKQPIAAAATNVGTCLRWLQRQPAEIEEAREAAARIAQDVNRAADVINRVRSLYTKEDQQRELLHVNEVIEEMIILLRDEASRYSILIRSDLAKDLPKVIADRVQLQQVFMNLMLNGIEAMKDTTGELTTKSERTADGQILFSVTDTGVGLPGDNVQQIFDAFFTTKPQGTGMGLAITRSIIEAHGGRLWASANTGRGATFHFTLPSEASSSSTSAG
jgi:PAS domain S-box-containing protein